MHRINSWAPLVPIGTIEYMHHAIDVSNDRLAWGVAEFAAALGVSVNFIRLEILRGKLKAVKRGRRLLIPNHVARTYAGEIDVEDAGR
jgi:hypothetical protein